MAFRQTLSLLSQKSKSKSASWAARQVRDPFVKKRVSDPTAYRARSAFKLLEINEKWDQFLEHPDVNSVVDLGAAPGGWSQVVADVLGWGSASSAILAYPRERSAEDKVPESTLESEEDTDAPFIPRKKKQALRGKPKPTPLEHFDPLNIDDIEQTASERIGRGTIVSVDLLNISPIPGVQTIKADFMLESTVTRIHELLVAPGNPYGKADVILSDMAANVAGNDSHDMQASLEICESVFEFAKYNLRTADSIGRRRGGVLL